MPTAIVYGAETGIIRRIIVTDDPSSIPDHAGDGERYLVVSDAVLVRQENGVVLPALDLAYQALKDATGIEPDCYRCLVIEDGTGDVKDVICADPTLDSIDGHTLYPDWDGGPGYTPDENGNFVNPPEES